jgi:DNA-3-methyladenine glycosylase I
MPVEPHLIRSADGLERCWWCGDDPAYVRYHDVEWGVPVADDRRLFEKICLEGFQAGLSWLTILRKRENFRRAFCDFDFERVARFNRADVERLLGDAGIVRHRKKIESTINNARRAVELAEREGSLAGFLWRYRPEPVAEAEGLVTRTKESEALSQELKRRGWTFIGPTTLYAMMQAVGFVNDHLPGCAIRERVHTAMDLFEPPR